jgi:hypothetical protein
VPFMRAKRCTLLQIIGASTHFTFNDRIEMT